MQDPTNVLSFFCSHTDTFENKLGINVSMCDFSMLSFGKSKMDDITGKSLTYLYGKSTQKLSKLSNSQYKFLHFPLPGMCVYAK
jgi:hypothetical protein